MVHYKTIENDILSILASFESHRLNTIECTLLPHKISLGDAEPDTLRYQNCQKRFIRKHFCPGGYTVPGTVGPTRDNSL